MMEDRYEIRGKIGEGGLGTVYRAMDTKMNREVAIKRIKTDDHQGLADEAHSQLSKEAKALASLQHPHIVTVYDAGTDDDGPYVVMEHIAGKTLDEIISRAPLTWEDFRELALQTQEALIAAQDLELVHGDLKPGNLMLTWLPSGKFQIKIVDFGLAVFTQTQNPEDYANLDVVYGSVFFMPPEQFKKSPLTFRSDMYSLGCVYYQALTCRYPFNGRTGQEVTKAHLEHSVIPLANYRKDLPEWVCDWVMWHIQCDPGERPPSAREALKKFLQHDRQADNQLPAESKTQQPVTETKPPATETETKEETAPPDPQPHITAGEDAAPPHSSNPSSKAYSRPKLVLPQRGGAAPATDSPKQPIPPDKALPVAEKSEPQLPSPVATTKANSGAPSVISPGEVSKKTSSISPQSKEIETRETTPDSSQAKAPSPATPPQSANLPSTTASPPKQASHPPETKKITKAIKLSSPQPLLPPPGSKTSLHKIPPAPAPAQPPPTSILHTQGEPSVSTAAHATIATAGQAVITGAQLPYQKKRGISNAAKVMIATALTILIIVFALVLKERMAQSKNTEIYNRLVTEAAKPSTTELLLNRQELDILLGAAVNVGAVKDRSAIYKALYLGKSVDGSNIDQIIAEFVTSREMLPDVKKKLIGEVLRMRKNPLIVPILMSFAGTTADHDAAAAAMLAIRSLADDKEFESVLVIIQGATNSYLRQEAENTATQIINKSDQRSRLADLLAIQYSTAISDDVRHSYLRLLGACGGDKALSTIQSILATSDSQQVTAAISALASWGDDQGFPVLLDFIRKTKDMPSRGRAFDSAHRYLSNLDDTGQISTMWNDLASEAKTRDEQISVMNGIANLDGDWPMEIVKSYLNSEDQRVADRAARTLDHMQDRRKLDE